MPTSVEIPGRGVVEFPDGMGPEQITWVIENEILPSAEKPWHAEQEAEPWYRSTYKAPPPEGNLENSISGIGASLKTLLPNTALMALENVPVPGVIPGGALDKVLDPAREAIIRGLGIREASQEANAAAAEATPQFEGFWPRAAYSAASSAIQTLPGMIASALTRNPAPVLANIGAVVAPEAYTRYRERGGTRGEALLGAGLETGAEIVAEKIPMGFLFDNLGKAGLKNLIVGTMLREVPTEVATTIAQNAIDTAIANPDKSWDQYFSELPSDILDTIGATVLQAGVTTGGAKAIDALAGKISGRTPDAPEVPGLPPETGGGATAGPPSGFYGESALPDLGAPGSTVLVREGDVEKPYIFRGVDDTGLVLIEDDMGEIFAEDPKGLEGIIHPAAPVSIPEVAAPPVDITAEPPVAAAPPVVASPPEATPPAVGFAPPPETTAPPPVTPTLPVVTDLPGVTEPPVVPEAGAPITAQPEPTPFPEAPVPPVPEIETPPVVTPPTPEGAIPEPPVAPEPPGMDVPEQAAPAAENYVFTEDHARELSAGDPDLAEKLKGTNVPQAARILAERTPSPYYASLANLIANIAETLAKRGIRMPVFVTGPRGAPRSASITTKIDMQDPRVAGVSVVSRPWTPWVGSEVAVRGKEDPASMRGPVGEETLLHELLHSVTSVVQAGVAKGKVPVGSRLHTAAVEMKSLADNVISRVEDALGGSNPLPEEAQRHLDNLRRSNAFDNEREVLAWGLTNYDMQQVLKAIPVKKTNAFTEFVRIIGKMLGIQQKDQNALRKLIEISEDLLPADTAGQMMVADVMRGTAVKGGPVAGEPPVASEQAVDDTVAPSPAIGEGPLVSEQRAPIRISKDNPGGEWLERKKARADADMANASAGDVGTSARGLDGSTTAQAQFPIPVKMLREYPGVLGEMPALGQPKFDALDKSVRSEGFNQRSPVMVWVNHKGQPFIYEGNNRIAIAAREGVKFLNAEVQWRNGAEDVSGPLSLESIRAAEWRDEIPAPPSPDTKGGVAELVKPDLETYAFSAEMQERNRGCP